MHNFVCLTRAAAPEAGADGSVLLIRADMIAIAHEYKTDPAQRIQGSYTAVAYGEETINVRESPEQILDALMALVP
jgi:hypothetical protein